MECERKPLILTIVSKDGQKLQIGEEAARKSQFLSSMLELTDADQDKLTDLEIPNYDAETLTKVFEWCEMARHKTPRVKDPENPRITLTEEEKAYLAMPNSKLLNILLCANYLNIGELIEIITQKIASFIEGKSVEEARRIYMLEDDLDDATKEEIRKRHEWCLQ